MRPLAELRSTPSTTSSSSSCRSSSGTPPYTNGDGGVVGGAQTGNNNRRILTRSSALQSLKVLRSGRRTSSSLNSALSSSPLSKHSKVSSPGAYARHYHSYRTSSSGSGRRVTQANTQPQLLQPPPLSRVKRRRSLRSTKGRRRSLNSPPHLVPQHDLNLRPKLRSTKIEKEEEEEDEEVNGGGMGCSSSSKRRSALWVLNCEAEEFLFGETAADKHELELPPAPPTLELEETCEDGMGIPMALSLASPPPAKKQRRRWRETELSHLLETSAFLESKLRSSSLSPSSSSSDDPTPPPPPIAPAPPPLSAKRRRTKKPTGEIQNGNCNSNSHPPLFFLPPPLKLLPPRPPTFLQSPSELAASTTPPSLVATLPFTFSFEEPPSESLLWASHSPVMSFAPPISLGEPPPLRLPYESRRVVNRGLLTRRLKVPRHARKSPRCHASTLAIDAATTEENPSPPPISVEPTPVVAPIVVPPGPMSPLSKWVHETTTTTSSSTPSPLRRSRRTATTTTSVGSHRPLGSGPVGAGGSSLSAQQFLWDSIQWLSDPYVVALLAGEDPPAQIPLCSPAVQPPPPSTAPSSAVKSSNERKASLRRPKNGLVTKKVTTNGKVTGSNGIVNLQMNGKVKNQPVVMVEDIMKSKDHSQKKECPPLLFMSGDGLPPLPLIPWTA